MSEVQSGNGKLNEESTEAKAVHASPTLSAVPSTKVHPATNRELLRSTLVVVGAVCSLCGLLIGAYLKVVSTAEAKSVEKVEDVRVKLDEHKKVEAEVHGHLHTEQVEMRRDMRDMYLFISAGRESKRLATPIEAHELPIPAATSFDGGVE